MEKTDFIQRIVFTNGHKIYIGIFVWNIICKYYSSIMLSGDIRREDGISI